MASSLYKFKAHTAQLMLKKSESTKMENIGIFYLLEITKGRKLQFCVPEIVEPDKIHSEHQGSS